MLCRSQAAGVHVLVQRATKGYVHDLHAAADAQRGNVEFVRESGKLQLQRVARVEHVSCFGKLFAVAVSGRRDVASAGKHQPVDAFDKLACDAFDKLACDAFVVFVRAVYRRQQNRHRSRGGNASHVLCRNAFDGNALVLLLFHHEGGRYADDHALVPLPARVAPSLRS